MQDEMTIENTSTGETKTLVVVDGDPKAKTVILRWPMCGDLVFNSETGRAKSLRHNQWRLTDESKAGALEYLRKRKELIALMIATSGRP